MAVVAKYDYRIDAQAAALRRGASRTLGSSCRTWKTPAMRWPALTGRVVGINC